MKSYFFFIYKITSPSGKVYIGQSKNLQVRFTMYRNQTENKQPVLLNSIKKYGWESFKIEIIFNGVCTQEEINKLEEYHINKYFDMGISMNSSRFAHDFPHEKGKVKNNNCIYQYNKKGKLIKKWENSLQISNNTGLNGYLVNTVIRNKTHLAYNYFWFYEENNNSEYILETIKRKSKKKITHNKRVVQLTKEGEYIKTFESISNACLELNIRNARISGVLSGKFSFAGKFRWVTEEQWLKKDYKLRPLNIYKKPIIFIDEENNKVIEYSSIKEASEELNIHRTSIIRYLKSKCKNKKGYKFIYKNI